MSEQFGGVNFDEIVFPAVMKVDWIRIYQRKGQTDIGCDPEGYPTTKYIQDHIEAYTNPNFTVRIQSDLSLANSGLWANACRNVPQIWSEYTDEPWPKNKLLEDC